jgi:hypothetical protein
VNSKARHHRLFASSHWLAADGRGEPVAPVDEVLLSSTYISGFEMRNSIQTFRMIGFAMQMIMNARVRYTNDTKCVEMIGNAQVCEGA